MSTRTVVGSTLVGVTVELSLILRDAPLLFEGAMGTMLTARGLPVGAPPELFTLERPDVVADIHRRYVSAGARVLKTNTFNTNPLRLAGTSLADTFATCIHEAVAIARGVSGPTQLVAGSIGPTGTLLAPSGTVEVSRVRGAFRAQAKILAESGVDLLLVETMTDVREAEAALAACRDVCDKSVIVTLALSRGRGGFVTPAGDAAGDALVRLVDGGASAVGANCNLDSSSMAPLAGAMRAHVPGPLLLQPCAGQPQVRPEGVWYPDTPEDFARAVRRMVHFGIAMIGGCCGTTPEHIRAARAVLDEPITPPGA